MTDAPKRVRRTKYQIAAARKLKYSIFVGGGDGEWIVLTRCTKPWRYRLFHDQASAEARLSELNRDKCCDHPPCQGAAGHSVFKLRRQTA